MGQEKVKEKVQCSWLKDLQHSIEELLRESGGRKGRRRRRTARSKGRWRGGRGRRYKMGRWEKRGLKTRVGWKCSISREGRDCTVKVYMSGKSEEGVTVLRVGM